MEKMENLTRILGVLHVLIIVNEVVELVILYADLVKLVLVLVLRDAEVVAPVAARVDVNQVALVAVPVVVIILAKAAVRALVKTRVL